MRVCSGAGCLRAVADGVRFCVECAPQRTTFTDDIRNHTSGYDPELDRLRKSTRWQRIRDLAVRACPMCAVCERHITEIVDHIVPAREAISQAQVSGLYPFDKFAGYFLRSNLQGLCRACHYLKTLADKTHVGPWPDVIAKEQAAPKKRWTF